MSKKMLTLMTNDGHQFTIEEELAVKSTTIKNMVDSDCVSSVIPLLNVDSETLTLIIEFLHKPDTFSDSVLNNYFDGVQNFSKLFDLVNAVNYLDIRDLLDIVCQKVAYLIRDKSVEEVRAIFNITNDFTPEEEKAIRDEFAWAFE